MPILQLDEYIIRYIFLLLFSIEEIAKLALLSKDFNKAIDTNSNEVFEHIIIIQNGLTDTELVEIYKFLICK